MAAKDTRDEAGFTLLEVVVALVIASLALGVLFSGALTGLRSARASAEYEEAVSRAKSHLAVVGHGGAVVPGEQSGDDGGGFRYLVRIAPIQSGPATFGELPAEQAPKVVLYSVAVAISWSLSGAERTVRLTTERLALTAPTKP